MGDEKALNWVERRGICETNRREQAPKIWQEVLAALQDACESFSKHYPFEKRANCNPCTPDDDGQVARITRIAQKLSGSVLVPDGKPDEVAVVTFTKQSFSISSGKLKLSIQSDDSGVCVMESDKHLTPDEVSRRILEPHLFPQEKMTPRIRQL